MVVKRARQDGLSRRAFLLCGGALITWSRMPSFAGATGRDPRLLVVILRGAMDGLAVVPPIGDPEYPALRGAMAIGTPGLESVLALDGYFGLNNALPKLQARYKAGDALFVHAVATPYRERSHFDGQDVLESGMPGPNLSRSGWLNRAVGALPPGEGIRPASGLIAGAAVPLIMRGEAPTLSWTPPTLAAANPDTVARLLDLYMHTDPELARQFSVGAEFDMLVSGASDEVKRPGLVEAFRRVASGSARILAKPDGPRIAALSFNGWDTHFNEGVDHGRLAKLLSALDEALDALARELAAVWHETVIAVVTEFGRTARRNGSEGTDHGTGTTALLLGGAVNGGRVIADWPGLKPERLFEARDLAPTTDLRAVLKGVLRDHLGLSERVLADVVFPDSLGVPPLDRLVTQG